MRGVCELRDAAMGKVKEEEPGADDTTLPPRVRLVAEAATKAAVSPLDLRDWRWSCTMTGGGVRPGGMSSPEALAPRGG